MKNKEEESKEYFERNVLMVIGLTFLALFLDWLSVYLIINMNPWGTALAVPGLSLTLQALWLIVNPYAIIYSNRFEIKQSLLYQKEVYYLDAKKIEYKSSNKIILFYNDDEPETISVFGMRDSNKKLFNEKLAQHIALSVENRVF